MRVILISIFSSIISLCSIAQKTTNVKNIGDSCSYYYDTISKRDIFMAVNEMPSYKGGISEISKIIMNELALADSCYESTGNIYLQFIIEPDGKISNRKILRGYNQICNLNSKVLKTLDYLIDWIPGKCHGETVPVRYVLPIRIRLK